MIDKTAANLILLWQTLRKLVIPVGKRVSSAMDGELKSIHGAWIPAIHAGMTIMEIAFLKSNKDSYVGRNKAIEARSARWRFTSGYPACRPSGQCKSVPDRFVRRVREVLAGNVNSRCRSNRLIPAYFEMRIKMRAGAWETALFQSIRSGVVRFFSLILAVSALSVDAAYSANEKRPTEAAVKAITLWTHSDLTNGEHVVLEAAAARYNAGRYGHRIEIQHLNENVFEGQVNKAAADGRLPCLLEADGPFLYSLVWRGYLQPIGKFLPKSLLDDVLPSILAQGSYEGQLYSLGQFDSGLALWGNRRLLNDVGVRIPTLQRPWTLAEFEQVLDKLSKLPGVVSAIEMGTNITAGEFYSYAYSPILQGFGGDLIERSNYRSAKGTLDGPQSVAGMTRLQQWFNKGWAKQDAILIEVNGQRKVVLTRFNQLDSDYFAQGKAALSWIGHWEYRRYSRELGKDLMLLPMPDFGHGIKTGMGSWSYAISSTCSDPVAATNFLGFLMSEQEILRMTDVNGAIPARRSVLAKSPLYGERGPLSLYVQQINAGLAVPRPQTPAYCAISRAFANAVVAIIAGAEVQTELGRAAALIDRDIAENLGYTGN
jgi:multiple sugar transport system substrate-binding protein